MGVLGFGAAGAGLSRSLMFDHLPFRNWREWGADLSRAWVEEWIDAIGLELDIDYALFGSPSARALLLDPATAPDYDPTEHIATRDAPPTGAASRDSVLDILLYLVGIPWPVNSSLTTAQKRDLVAAGWDLLVRKGARSSILRLASIYGDGVAYGWTIPPWTFNVIIPDGDPTPGWGTWVRSTAAAIPFERPWIIPGIDAHLAARLGPAWSTYGNGYSQFRAGYSGAGEPVLSPGARLNILANEHFATWAAGVPTLWSNAGAGTLVQDAAAPAINWEFTPNACRINLTAAAAGVYRELYQSNLSVNNEVPHRFQVDYTYRQAAAPFVDHLVATIYDATNIMYWNPDTGAWQGSTHRIPLPVSATTTTRTRYACDVTWQSAPAASTTRGTARVRIGIEAASDGTASTMLNYTLYRAGLYEKFDEDIEADASGERMLWLPLVDALGWTTFVRGGGGGTIVENANARRSAYMTRTATQDVWPYHPAVTGRGYQSNALWENLLLGSNDFDADWTLTNATIAPATEISPIVGETVATAPTLTQTGVGCSVAQANIVADSGSKVFAAGVWAKKLSSDGDFLDITLTLEAIGGATTHAHEFTLTQSDGWRWLALDPGRFTAGDAGCPLTFTIGWAANIPTGGEIALASAYCYDTSGKYDLLYPPIVQSAIGATETLPATTLFAQVSAGTVKHPLILRGQTSVRWGMLACEVVPVYGADTMPASYIFAAGEIGVAQNRILLYADGAGAIVLEHVDNGGASRTVSVSITNAIDPAAGSATWKRDTSVQLIARWDIEGGLSLSVGNGYAQTAFSGVGASDAATDGIAIGHDLAGANQFDGLIRNVEVIQIGVPI